MLKALTPTLLLIFYTAAVLASGCHRPIADTTITPKDSLENPSITAVTSTPCGFINLQKFFFPTLQKNADSSIVQIVGEILAETGMHLTNNNKNFYLTQADAVGNNAVAISQPIITTSSLLIVHRFIICGPAFISAISGKCSLSGIYVLLAHEISHHLNGDSFTDRDLPEDRRQAELAADSFAGYLCFQLNRTHHFTLDSCTLVYQIFGDSLDTDTHPNKRARIQSFTSGWMTGMKYSAMRCEALNAVTLNPQLAIQQFSADNPQYVNSLKSQYLSAISSQSTELIGQIQDYAKSTRMDTALINLRGDLTPIVRTRDNELINKQGDTLVSTLRPLGTATPRSDVSQDYLIDQRNIIWARYPNGLPYIAGYLRKK